MTHEQFKQQILPHYPAMYRMAMSVTHSADDAADIVQDVFVKLWHKRDDLESVNNIAAYCMATTRNQCITHLQTKKDTISSDAPESKHIESPTDVYRQVERRDSISIIHKIIASLPENQQQVINLSTFAHMTNDEISAATGLSNANVRTLLSRSRKKVKELFSKYNSL